MKYNDGFECDKYAKNVAKQLVNYWFSAFTVAINEENEADEFAPVDLIFTAFTKSGKEIVYAIEIKHRMGYKHNDFDEWMIERHKYNTLSDYKKKGYRVLYFNLFKDGYYYLWDYDTIKNKHKDAVKNLTHHTQGEDEESELKVVYLIKAEDCIISGNTGYC